MKKELKNINGLITTCFLVFSSFYLLAQAPTDGVVLDKIISKVDNQIILKSEYDMAYLQLLQSSDSKLDFNVTPCRVLEQLLTNKLLLAKAEIDSVVVDDKQVEAEMDNRMEYFVSQIGSKEKLEAYYNKSISQLKADLRKQVKDQLVVQKMQKEITNKIKITPGEVKKFYGDIPKDSLPFFSKELEIGHIVKFPIISRSQKQLSREKLEKVRNMIVNENESFQKLAQQLSEDPISARNGGELGFFKKGELVPEYEAAAMKLKVGETSPVVESAFGFHIIQMIERRGNEFNSRHILLKANSSETDIEGSEKYLDSLRSQIISDSITFEKAAKEYSDDKASKEIGGMLMDPNTNTTKIPSEAVDPVLYFMLDTMKTGSVTKPLRYRTEDGKDAYRIVYYKSVTKPHQANLKDDYLKIQNAALQEKKNKAINSWFTKSKGEVFIEVDTEFKDCEILKGL